MRPNPPRLGPRVLVSALDTGELLHQSRDNVGRFRAHELLRRTGPRPAAERDKIPQRLEPGPTLGAKCIGIRTPDILVSMQTVYVERYVFTFAYEDRRFAVQAAASGEDGIV